MNIFFSLDDDEFATRDALIILCAASRIGAHSL